MIVAGKVALEKGDSAVLSAETAVVKPVNSVMIFKPWAIVYRVVPLFTV